MRISFPIFMLCCATTLAGCAGKPGMQDIKPQLSKLKAAWAQCHGLKLTQLKKASDIAHGSTYEMVVSYQLKITQAASARQAWYGDTICATPGMRQRLWSVGKLDNKFGQALKAGEIIKVNDMFTMVKSGKGWTAR